MRLVFAFLLRWIVTSFGLWIAIRLFGTGQGTPDIAAESSVFLTAGLVLSIVNIFIKPLVTIISFLITFWSAVLAGIVIGIVNYGVNETLGALKAAK